MSRAAILIILLLASAALGLRWPFLEERPFHNDEAVNAVKIGQLWDGGGYRYDPHEHHGPTLYYATALFQKIAGASPDSRQFSHAQLRSTLIVFGVSLVLLIPLLYDGLGRKGMCFAALFLTVSPAFVYYSRYYIHEMILIWAAMLALGAAWRYWRSRRLGWLLLSAVGLALMHTTKETFVISVGCAAGGLVLNQVWNRWIDASGNPEPAAKVPAAHLVLGAVVWLVVAFLIFSSFFSNLSGPLDSIRTYEPWLKRAGGDSPHIHPWYFYLHRLLWFQQAQGPVFTEMAILLLGAVGAYAGFKRHHLGGASASLVRFIAFYTLLVLSAYSVISYKTPWCLLNFWHGFVLLAGVGASFLWHAIPNKTGKYAVLGLILGAAAHLSWQSWLMNASFAADQRNPHVYAHTAPNLDQMVEKIEEVASAAAAPHDLVIKVIGEHEDYWPLPWELRKFNNVGYYGELPADPYAPIMVVSASLNAGLDRNKTHLMVGYFALRPAVFMELYVELELWKSYLSQRKPDPQSAERDP